MTDKDQKEFDESRWTITMADDSHKIESFPPGTKIVVEEVDYLQKAMDEAEKCRAIFRAQSAYIDETYTAERNEFFSSNLGILIKELLRGQAQAIRLIENNLKQLKGKNHDNTKNN